MAGPSTLQIEQALVGLRVAIGTGAWFTPRLTIRLLGVNPKGNPQSPYLARLFGIRDLALGVGLSRSRGESRRLWIRLGMLCDGADAVAGLLAGRKRYLNPSATVLVSAAGAGAVVIGAWLLSSEQVEG